MRTWDNFAVPITEGGDLFFFARTGNLTGLRRALRPGPHAPDVNARDARGHTPLLLAAYHGYLEAADFLLAQGADPNLADETGHTPLLAAAFRGNLAAVKLLLRGGADPEWVNHRGLSALGLAELFSRTEVRDLLRGHAAVHVA